ncbi:MAG: sugar ABC transporter ATP-binding protein [Lachnospiraceae bacterium]|jgi:ABC-type sugar transport system ATPase subunit|nr:sugar ABC transporter ATP-binding protein [Lachnospiraceae bacterium]
MSYLKIEHITKSFGNNNVLTDISIDFEKGEIHSLIGENGAGKSTLMKIIGGIYQPDGGQILIDGNPVRMHDPIEACELGIGIVHQELSIAGNMTAAQNVFVNNEPVKWLGFIDWKKLYADAAAEFEKIGAAIDPRAIAGTLSVGMQQMIEISKVLSKDVNVLILDEPTSALSDNEIENLFRILLELKKRGKLIIFISHKLNEIIRISDKVSVLRDGTCTGTLDKEHMEVRTIIRMMVGRNIDELYPPKAKSRSHEKALSVEHISRKGKFSDLSFDVCYGEITGMFGLVGAGRTECALSVFGADKMDEGLVYLEGKPVRFKNPAQAIREGVCYLSEDRKAVGLFVDMTVKENTVAACLKSICKYGQFLDEGRAGEITENYIKELDIHPDRCAEYKVMNLSGGNQQKVLFAKWLSADPRILIVDEPTRGVDVGAKAMIHHILRKLADAGMAVWMISSELPEILGVSDRVIVMHEGRCKAILENKDLVEEDVMRAAFREEEGHE